MEELSSSARKKSFSVENLISSKGGLSSDIKLGFAVIVVSGDPDNTNVSAMSHHGGSGKVSLQDFHFSLHRAQPISSAGNVGADVVTPALGKIAMSGRPNPSSSGIFLNISLQKSTNVQLEILTVDGKKVASAYSGAMNAGANTIYWNGRGSNGARVAPNYYFARLSSPEGSKVTRLVLIK
jgi:hypothetical protein